MKTTHDTSRNGSMRGGLSFRMILVIGVIITTAVILLALASAPPKKDAVTQQNATNPTTGDPTTNSDNVPADSGTSGRSTGDTKVVKIPDGFKRFTSKQYGFTVAFPESWGGLLAQPNMGGTTLYALTGPARYPLGSAEANGQFFVGVYPANSFKAGIRPTNPMVMPEEKDGKVTWRVVSADANDTYRIGNIYPVKSLTTASGLTVYDFTWVLNGKRQIRWAYKSGNNYILMAAPTLSRPDGQEPTGADLTFYASFAESIRDTAGVAKQ